MQPTNRKPAIPPGLTREQYTQALKDYHDRCLEGARLIQECAHQMLLNMGMTEEEAIALRKKVESRKRRKKTRKD